MGQYTSYWLYQRYETRDGQTIPSYPNYWSVDGDGTMSLSVKIENDSECGWHCDPQYDWRTLPIDQTYWCDDCPEGVGTVQHKWELGDGYICVDTTKHQALYLYYDKGNGWNIVTPSIIKPGNVIEEKSFDCGYEIPRLRATLADGSVKEISRVVSGTHQTGAFGTHSMTAYGVPPSQIAKAEFFLSYNIYPGVFAGCQTLTSLTLNSRDTIQSHAFFGSGLKEISGYFYQFGSRIGAEGYQFANCKSLTSVTVTNETLHYAFNSFGVFANCTSLAQIDVSKLFGMYTGGCGGGGGCGMEGMFLGCSSLRTAKVAPGISDSCFERCTSLESVDIYCGVVEDYGRMYVESTFGVGNRAFFNCRNLSALTISYHDSSVWPPPSSSDDTIVKGAIINGDPYISSIGDFAFYNCERLPVEQIENKLGLYYASVLPGGESATGTTSYAAGAFVNCKAFTHIPIPHLANVSASDPYGAIKYIPVTKCPVTSVGSYAFSGCTGLHELVFDEYLESIGKNAFNGCTGLTGITIDRLNPPTLGEGAFDNTNNCNIYVPCDAFELYQTASDWGPYVSRLRKIAEDCTPVGKVKFIGREGDYNYGVYNVACNESATLTSGDTAGVTYTDVYQISISNCVTSIDSYTFANSRGFTDSKYTSVRKIDLPNTITELPSYLFRSFTSLSIINIPDSVTTIGWRTFSHCSSLTELTIPSGVTTIGCYAFEDCTSLTSFTILAETPPTISCVEGIFSSSYVPTIYVPAASVETFKTTSGWRTYANNIQAIQ